MANISEASRFNNPALAAFAQKMAQARAVNVPQTHTAQSAPLTSAENAVKENVETNIVEETNQKPEGAFVRKGMFLDIRV